MMALQIIHITTLTYIVIREVVFNNVHVMISHISCNEMTGLHSFLLNTGGWRDTIVSIYKVNLNYENEGV